MKSKFSALALTLAVMFPTVSNAGEASATIEVTGLYCSSCPYIAAQAIMAVPSAKIVDGYYDARAQMAQFVIKYDDDKATLDQLLASTVDYGYPSHQVDQVTPDGKS